MHNRIYTFVLFTTTFLLFTSGFAQSPAIEWQKTIGTSFREDWRKTIATSDSNLLVISETYPTARATDISVSKFGQNGQFLWNKVLGGSLSEYFYDAYNTPDGGYIVVSSTQSNDGDVVGFHTSTSVNSEDVWVVKLSASGSVEWQRCIGGTSQEYCNQGIVQPDGSFILAGKTTSTDGDFSDSHSANYDDVYVIKLNSNGNIVWKKVIGGSTSDYFRKMLVKSNGNVLVAGDYTSSDGNMPGNKGDYDIFLAELDANNGSVLWLHNYGGSKADYCSDILQTGTGKYTVIGTTASLDGDVSGMHGDFQDFWVFSVDENGSLLWQKAIGGSNPEYHPNMYFVPADSSLVIAGTTYSSDGDMTGGHGDMDTWVAKLSNSGNLLWKRCLGGSGHDYFNQCAVDQPGQVFILATITSNDGDVAGSHGDQDLWFVKLTATGAIEWQRPLGGSSFEGYGQFFFDNDKYTILTNTTSNDGDVQGMHYQPEPYGTRSYADIWLVNISPNGTINWQKALGGYNRDYDGQIVKLNGKYFVGGETESNDGDVSGNHGDRDAWLVELGTYKIPQPVISGLVNNYCGSAAIIKGKIMNLPDNNTTTSVTLDSQTLPVVTADSTFSFTVSALQPGWHTITVIYSRAGDSKTTTANFSITAAVTPDVNTSANITQVTSATDPVVITATNASGGGKTPLYTFAWNRTFANIIQAESSTNTVSIAPSTLVIGDNKIYVRMKTSENCFTVSTNVDSITIRRDQSTGIIDVDNPGQVINVYPNPFNGPLTINGLSTAKTYTVNVSNINGQVIFTKRVTNRSTIEINRLKDPAGVYWLNIYDEKKKRLLGSVKLLKQ